jgi:Tfp pilus assembly protein PilF
MFFCGAIAYFCSMNRIEQLEEFLRESPQDPFLHYALTMEFLKADDTARARAGFENMLTNFPDYVGSYYHFGKFLEKLGESAKAEEVYKKGILVATKMRNNHAKGELMGALNMLLGMDDDEDC